MVKQRPRRERAGGAQDHRLVGVNFAPRIDAPSAATQRQFATLWRSDDADARPSKRWLPLQLKALGGPLSRFERPDRWLDQNPIRCADNETFVAEIRRTAEWNREQGYWIGIDYRRRLAFRGSGLSPGGFDCRWRPSQSILAPSLSVAELAKLPWQHLTRIRKMNIKSERC
jgi:hypothetical protein